MKISGTYTIAAPHDDLWPMLMDPEVLANIVPGCESLDQVAENEYTGILRIKVGPVQGKFNGRVELSEIDAPAGCQWTVDGKGSPGFVRGKGTLRLEPEGDQTCLHYEGDAQVGGRLASVGQRLLESSAKAIIRQSLEGLEKQVDYRLHPERRGDTSSAPPSAPAPSQTEFALGVAKQMTEEMLAEENREQLVRKTLLIGGLLLVLYLIAEWMSGRIATKVARQLS